MADIELKREQTIEYAEHFKDYELSLAKHQFDIEMSIAEDEYKVYSLYIMYFVLILMPFHSLRSIIFMM